jgi:hypothetical protein
VRDELNRHAVKTKNLTANPYKEKQEWHKARILNQL